MLANHLIGDRKMLAVLFVDSLAILRLGRVVGLPVSFRVRHVAVSAVGTLPANRVDILTAAEKRMEQRHLCVGVHLTARLRQSRFRGRSLTRAGRDFDRVIAQDLTKPPQLLAQFKALFQRRVELAARNGIVVHYSRRTASTHFGAQRSSRVSKESSGTPRATACPASLSMNNAALRWS